MDELKVIIIREAIKTLIISILLDIIGAERNILRGKGRGRLPVICEDDSFR